MLACGCDRCGHSGREIATKTELRRLAVNETGRSFYKQAFTLATPVHRGTYELRRLLSVSNLRRFRQFLFMA